MSDDDSLGSAGDDDVQVAAQISSMLKPLTKKQSKMGKRLSALEGVVAKMAAPRDADRGVGARAQRAARRGGGTGELREFAPMPPPGRPSPPGRPRSREHSFAD